MSTVDYLAEIVRDETLQPDSAEMKALQLHREHVETVLKSAYEDGKPTIRYGGSYAKKTMTKIQYDLDIICYFDHDATAAGETLKEIYDSVADTLSSDYKVQRKVSALRLRGKEEDNFDIDFHIDVVPGRFTDADKGDVFIYQQGSEKGRLKTNLDKHIVHIRDSGLTDVIKLAKVWNVRRMLEVKTFLLELMVVKLLAEHKKADIEKQLLRFWQAIIDADGNIPVEDPANPSGNDLSNLNSGSLQLRLAAAARATVELVEAGGWETIYGQIESDKREELLSNVAVQSTSRTKPWADSRILE